MQNNNQEPIRVDLPNEVAYNAVFDVLSKEDNAELFLDEHEGSTLVLTYPHGETSLCRADGAFWLLFDFPNRS